MEGNSWAFQLMKDIFNFKDSGLRWISHRLNALHKFYDKFKVFVLHLEKLIREATTKEKITLKGVRRKVVSFSVIINAGLFSDILAPVKDLSIALQNNSFNIDDATTKITECIGIYKKFPKHWWEICFLVFISPKTDAQKWKWDLPKHRNKLCSHSRFTHQKCSPIHWIDCQLSPKPLWRPNKINATIMDINYETNTKFRFFLPSFRLLNVEVTFWQLSPIFILGNIEKERGGKSK